MNTFELFKIFNISVPVKDPVVLTDNLPNMVARYTLETSSIAINLAQMKYVLLTYRTVTLYIPSTALL